MLFVILLLNITGVYLLCGLLFTIPFLLKGICIVDETAKGSSWGFKLIIVPGVIVFWPLLLKKWLTVIKTGKP